MNIELTRGQRAKLHTAMQDALNVPADGAFDIKYVKQQALFEAICWSDSPAETLLLGLRIDAFICAALWGAEEKYVEVDATDLRAHHGGTTTSIALRLAGVCPRDLGQKVVWITAPGNERTLAVTLPANLMGD